MPYISSSPWKDAAEYGAGLGNTLGSILAGMPQQRAQLAIQQAQQQLAAAKSAADTAKSASQASLGGDTALSSIVNSNPAMAKMLGRTVPQTVPEAS